MTPEEYYKRYLEGDDEAIAGIIDAYYNELLRFVVRITGNYHDAEDVVQEVFIRISLKKNIYRGVGDFKAWVFEIARNCALNEQRGRKTVLEKLDFDEEKLNMIAGPAIDDPETRMILQEEYDHFLETLKGLKEEYRQVLKMMYIDGCSAEEVGRKMGIRKAKVYKLAGKAKESYRRMAEGSKKDNEQN